MVRSSPGADVDVALLLEVLHEKHTGVSQIVDMQELAPRLAGSPDRDFRHALELRVVELADEGRQHMGARQIEVVVGPV